MTAISVLGIGVPAAAFTEETQIVSVTVGGGHSDAVRDLRSGGYELSDGSAVSFSSWYTSDWRDLRAVWMTEVARDFGVFWGFGTGERGEKYTIDPSVHLGVVLVGEITERSRVSLTATTVLGGWLREKTCEADYGAIGGVQTVNCRLAATSMPPSETLDYLITEPPVDRIRVSLRYQFEF